MCGVKGERKKGSDKMRQGMELKRDLYFMANNIYC